MPLFYSRFSDPKIDWPMILIAWQGFANHKMSAEQVISYALDQIGQGTPEQDEIAAFLVNTNPLDWQTLNRHLEQIAEEPFDRITALRKWRLAELKDLVDKLRLPDDYEDEDELWTAFYAISDFWVAYRNELPGSEEVLPEYGEPISEMLLEQQAWIKREEIALRDGAGVEH